MDLDSPPTVPESPAGVLRVATEVVRRRRLVEVEDLEVLATWAALHSGDPTQGPGGAAARRRGDVLVLLGGEGTPAVQDFCLGEIALARGTGVTATTNALADVLDLRHRLPRVWARCRAGEAEVFVARRVAKLSRHLPLAAVAHVDAAVAQVVATESGGRTLAVAEGAIVAADPALHDERVDEQRKRRYVGLGRVDEFGLRTIIARTEAADAVWLDDLLDRVAQVIAPQHPDATPQEIRAVALGLVARPAEVLALLGESTSGETERARQAPRVVLHVHLHEAALAAGATAPGSVARVEGLGPATLARVRELLVGARVTVQPVLDLSDRVRTTAYEHPGSLKQRVHLVTGGDYWPYATSTSRGVDHDHPTPYDPHGPPGQTGTHNSGPLGRRHHRWKTHAGYRARQAGEGRYVWLTPHGLGFVVDSSGTRRVSAEHARAILDAPPGVDVYPMFR